MARLRGDLSRSIGNCSLAVVNAGVLYRIWASRPLAGKGPELASVHPPGVRGQVGARPLAGLRCAAQEAPRPRALHASADVRLRRRRQHPDDGSNDRSRSSRPRGVRPDAVRHRIRVQGPRALHDDPFRPARRSRDLEGRRRRGEPRRHRLSERPAPRRLGDGSARLRRSPRRPAVPPVGRPGRRSTNSREPTPTWEMT